MKRTLVICDPETEYTRRLMEFMNGRKTPLPRAEAFDSFPAAADHIRENGAEMLLLSEQFLEERENELEDLNAKKIVILGENAREQFMGYETVFKYLPADRLVREIESAYDAEMRAGLEGSAEGRMMQRGKVCVIYSPVGGCGKTSFALTLGMELAKTRRVLYLNLECGSALSKVLDAEGPRTVSDLIYLVRQDPEAAIKRLPEMVVTICGLDCVLPAECFGDIAALRPGECTTAFTRILAEGFYDVILVEPADSLQGFAGILEYAGRIFMPCRSDAVSIAKLEGFTDMLSESGMEDLLEKTVRIRVPYFNVSGIGRPYYESLPWSELGDCVRGLIGKEGIV